MLPAVIALIAENTGHVKAVAEMTGHDLDPVMGKAIAADGFGTMLASSVGGSPTTTYAENIGVMAATRVYSTAAYYVAAAVAILFGLSPKFGALVASIPGGVLGGITVVLYGMIGLLGAKIWKENGVDFGNPINLVPDRRRHHHRHRQRQGRHHRGLLARGHRARHHRRHRRLPPGPRDRPEGAARGSRGHRIAVGDHVYGDSDGVDDLYQEGYPGAPGHRDPERDKRP